MSEFHWTYQNLDERPGDGWEASGHIWKRGRATVWFWNFATVRWGWNLWSRFCGVELSCSSEDGLTFRVSFPPVSFHFGVDFQFLQNWYYKHDWKSLGVRIFDWAIWFDFWADESCQRYYGSWFHPERRRFNWHPIDFFLGRSKYKERKLESEPITVHMPEGTYKGTATRFVSEWKRPRWLFTRRMVRTKVEMEDPIPFPGKGESSWDCGEDALHSQTSPADTIPKAIASVIKSVLTSRRKYGGKNWKPEAKA